MAVVHAVVVAVLVVVAARVVTVAKKAEEVAVAARIVVAARAVAAARAAPRRLQASLGAVRVDCGRDSVSRSIAILGVQREGAGSKRQQERHPACRFVMPSQCTAKLSCERSACG